MTEEMEAYCHLFAEANHVGRHIQIVCMEQSDLDNLKEMHREGQIERAIRHASELALRPLRRG
ncbi:hypothetical protein JQ599_09620 [Bradyrhizobium diazoefficiens]|nr:hypothetical protein [Bradyrhizobium diazoefficiens]MBR0700157.1 hypothetical protein [Bradyrhizobium diazoefficiens]MBR0768492.1 hypothetical protein [Bradyrhizobium diazoefficiens]